MDLSTRRVELGGIAACANKHNAMSGWIERLSKRVSKNRKSGWGILYDILGRELRRFNTSEEHFADMVPTVEVVDHHDRC